MSDMIAIYIVLLILVVLGIIRDLRVRRLENTLSEIISGEMLKGFYDAMREESNKPQFSDPIQFASQETLDELNSRFEGIIKEAEALNKNNQQE